MSERVWYKWPEGYFERDYKPWYKITVTLTMFPIVFSLICLLYVLLYIGYGKDEASDLWEHFF